MNDIKETTSFDLNRLFDEDQKLTFLVGAGCSIDPPSCLVAGRQMIEAIIKYTCIESEIDKILSLKDLRFEMLVEIVQDQLDKDLKLIDYYGACDRPNLQHFFLAEMIRKGHIVMTTNFDFLIELALRRSGINFEDIIPVITKDDFQKYSDPDKLIIQNKSPVYKIHGSTKNFITGEDTRKSLITTIQSFGKNKECLDVFQIEPFKSPVLDNISNERTLIVLGYSGSNDFDIMSTLKVLKGLKSLIWIKNLKDDKGSVNVQEFKQIDHSSIIKVDKIDRTLMEIKEINSSINIYCINVNTSRFTKGLLKEKYILNADNFSINPINWLKENIDVPSKIVKFYIPTKIYYEFDMYEDSLRCLNEIINITEKSKDEAWRSSALNDMGEIYKSQGKYLEALKRYNEALEIDDQLSNISGKAVRLNNIGLIYYMQGNYPEALKRYSEALKIAEQLGNVSLKAADLNYLGLIYYIEENYPEALKRYTEALKIHEQLGDPRGKVTDLNYIGGIYDAQENYLEALKQYTEALKIDEQLGDLYGKAIRLNNIGEIYKAQENYPEALKILAEALKIDDQIGDLKGKATRLSNIGEIFKAQADDKKALENFNASLKIFTQLGLGDSLNAKTLVENIEFVKNKMTYEKEREEKLKEQIVSQEKPVQNQQKAIVSQEKPIQYQQEAAPSSVPILPIPHKVNFCTKCGTKVAKPTDLFCINCGNRLR